MKFAKYIAVALAVSISAGLSGSSFAPEARAEGNGRSRFIDDQADIFTPEAEAEAEAMIAPLSKLSPPVSIRVVSRESLPRGTVDPEKFAESTFSGSLQILVLRTPPRIVVTVDPVTQASYPDFSAIRESLQQNFGRGDFDAGLIEAVTIASKELPRGAARSGAPFWRTGWFRVLAIVGVLFGLMLITRGTESDESGLAPAAAPPSTPVRLAREFGSWIAGTTVGSLFAGWFLKLQSIPAPLPPQDEFQPSYMQASPDSPFDSAQAKGFDSHHASSGSGQADTTQAPHHATDSGGNPGGWDNSTGIDGSSGDHAG